ncbi:hypothetical protein CCACVL1_02547 [Corchorus capsularis]|uniref:Uncharacterized protein n=1 Tax=Corchorus capsularis TaxID=210143 RepID=A0A1R3K7W2_COCAP|nr:hypothetical protein CCACVL1_02547 [Corchorus capsularis]
MKGWGFCKRGGCTTTSTIYASKFPRTEGRWGEGDLEDEEGANELAVQGVIEAVIPMGRGAGKGYMLLKTLHNQHMRTKSSRTFEFPAHTTAAAAIGVSSLGTLSAQGYFSHLLTRSFGEWYQGEVARGQGKKSPFAELLTGMMVHGLKYGSTLDLEVFKALYECERDEVEGTIHVMQEDVKLVREARDRFEEHFKEEGHLRIAAQKEIDEMKKQQTELEERYNRECQEIVVQQSPIQVIKAKKELYPAFAESIDTFDFDPLLEIPNEDEGGGDSVVVNQVNGAMVEDQANLNREQPLRLKLEVDQRAYVQLL